MGRSQAIQDLTDTRHDPRDPDPWYALYVDSSIPLADDAKAFFKDRAMGKFNQTVARRGVAGKYHRLSIHAVETQSEARRNFTWNMLNIAGRYLH